MDRLAFKDSKNAPDEYQPDGQLSNFVIHIYLLRSIQVTDDSGISIMNLNGIDGINLIHFIGALHVWRFA